MDSISGRGDRSDQPPPLAAVRPLRLDDHGLSSEGTEEDWYETERLTGQITGIAQRAVPEGPMLDWRNAGPGLSGRHRVRRSLRRPRPFDVTPLAWVIRWLRRRPGTIAAGAPKSEIPAGGIGVDHRNDPSPPLVRRRLAPKIAVGVAALVLVCAAVGWLAGAGQHHAPTSSLHASAPTDRVVGSRLKAGRPRARRVKEHTRKTPRARSSHRTAARAQRHSMRHVATTAHPGTVPSAGDSTGGSYVSGGTAGGEPAVEIPVSASKPASASSSASSDTPASGPSGLGGEVGNNCNPKCS